MVGASGYTGNSGSGSSAISIIYISPLVMIDGHNPDGILAEMGHELVHVYLAPCN